MHKLNFKKLMISFLLSIILGALCFPLMFGITKIINFGRNDGFLYVGFPVVYALIIYGISSNLDDKKVTLINFIFVLTIIIVNFFGVNYLLKQNYTKLTDKALKQETYLLTGIPSVILLLGVVAPYVGSNTTSSKPSFKKKFYELSTYDVDKEFRVRIFRQSNPILASIDADNGEFKNSI